MRPAISWGGGIEGAPLDCHDSVLEDQTSSHTLPWKTPQVAQQWTVRVFPGGSSLDFCSDPTNPTEKKKTSLVMFLDLLVWRLAFK